MYFFFVSCQFFLGKCREIARENPNLVNRPFFSGKECNTKFSTLGGMCEVGGGSAFGCSQTTFKQSKPSEARFVSIQGRLKRSSRRPKGGGVRKPCSELLSTKPFWEVGSLYNKVSSTEGFACGRYFVSVRVQSNHLGSPRIALLVVTSPPKSPSHKITH